MCQKSKKYAEKYVKYMIMKTCPRILRRRKYAKHYARKYAKNMQNMQEIIVQNMSNFSLSKIFSMYYRDCDRRIMMY